MLRFNVIQLFVLMGVFPLRSNVLLLNQQLSMMSVSHELQPYHEMCRSKPRFKYNWGGICYLNATIDIVYKLYCYEELRKAIVQVSPEAIDNDSIFRRITIEMLEDYNNPSIYDVQGNKPFAEEYDVYAAKVAGLNRRGFNICGGGGWSEVVIIDILESLLQKTRADIAINKIENMGNLIIQAIILERNWHNSDPGELFYMVYGGTPKKFPTLLENDLYVWLIQHSKGRLLKKSLVSLQWPQVLLVMFGSKYGKVRSSLYENRELLPLAPFTFPEILDIGMFFDEHDKPLQYRLCGMLMSSDRHASSIVRYGSQWYWASDELIAEYPESFILEMNNTLKKNSPRGNFVHFGVGGKLKELTAPPNATIKDVNTSDIKKYSFSALPSLFLYERIR